MSQLDETYLFFILDQTFTAPAGSVINVDGTCTNGATRNTGNGGNDIIVS